MECRRKDKRLDGVFLRIEGPVRDVYSGKECNCEEVKDDRRYWPSFSVAHNKANELIVLLQRLDVGAELAGGCYGFASKYMHWPEGLIVGGAKKNKSGHMTK